MAARQGERTRRLIESGAINTVSGVEDKVAAWLDEQGIAYERQVRLWYCVADFKVGGTYVEVNGCYWHGCEAHCSTLNKYQRKRRARDAGLRTYCLKHGMIPLLVIWEHDVRARDFSSLSPLSPIPSK